MRRPSPRVTSAAVAAVAAVALGLLAWPAAASEGGSPIAPKPPQDSTSTTVHIERREWTRI